MAVTTLYRPAFLSAKAAVPPLALTTSPSMVPVSVRAAMVAAEVPSYTLLWAVMAAVMAFGVMLARRVPPTSV